MNERYISPEESAPTSLPKVHKTVARYALMHPVDFEAGYRNIQKTNPALAGWLLVEAEKIAPNNTTEKERYAMLAIRLYEVLSQQATVNWAEGLFNASENEDLSTQAGDTCLTTPTSGDELHGGDAIEPPVV